MKTAFLFDSMAAPAKLERLWATPGKMYAYLLGGCPIPSGAERTMRKFNPYVVGIVDLKTYPVRDDVFDAEDVTFEGLGNGIKVDSVIITAGGEPAVYTSAVDGFPLTTWGKGSPVTVHWSNGPERIFVMKDPRLLLKRRVLD